jgi:hypothetical protein
LGSAVDHPIFAFLRDFIAKLHADAELDAERGALAASVVRHQVANELEAEISYFRQVVGEK